MKKAATCFALVVVALAAGCSRSYRDSRRAARQRPAEVSSESTTARKDWTDAAIRDHIRKTFCPDDSPEAKRDAEQVRENLQASARRRGKPWPEHEYENEPPEGPFCDGAHVRDEIGVLGEKKPVFRPCPGVTPGGKRMVEGKWVYRYPETDGRELYAVRYNISEWRDALNQAEAVKHDYYEHVRALVRLQGKRVAHYQCKECCDSSTSLFPWEYVVLEAPARQQK